MILQKNNSILRKKAVEVKTKDIGSVKIKKIIKNMIKALSKEPDGVAIAAPQTGHSLRIFVAAEHKINNEEKEKFITFINPKILKLSRKKEIMQEGCLSVRGIYGNVKRAEKLTIRAFDENGKKITRGASGLLAEIFQHEIDHLNGILFIDKASDLKRVDSNEK